MTRAVLWTGAVALLSFWLYVGYFNGFILGAECIGEKHSHDGTALRMIRCTRP